MTISWIRSKTMPDHLLDVNVLVAHAILEHTHHEILTEALRRALENGVGLFVCPIVELGLIRNAMRIGSISIQEARLLLENEYKNLRLQFIPDAQSASYLPDTIDGHGQTTDAYLNSLALEHGLTLLTIDKGIPGAVQVISKGIQGSSSDFPPKPLLELGKSSPLSSDFRATDLQPNLASR